YRIRKLSAAGVLSTFAGTGSSSTMTIGANQQATATSNMLSRSIASDAAGNIYIAAENAPVILKVDLTGVVTGAAGTLHTAGSHDGAVGTGKLNTPLAVTVGSDGALYIADYGNAEIRKAVNGVLTTIAGGGVSGSTPALAATFSTLLGLATDPAGND